MQRTILVKPDVKGFYESRTGSIQYVVSDPITGRSAIIDPVLDFDEKSGATATRSADMLLDYVDGNGLTVARYRRLGLIVLRRRLNRTVLPASAVT